jgi:hypothetical protein
LRDSSKFPTSNREPSIASWSTWTPPQSGGNNRDQKAGLKFEKEIGAYLRRWASSNPPHSVLSGKTIEDPTGLHIPDFVLCRGTSAPSILLEAKLTYTHEGMAQLYRYAPLVASLLSVDLILCQVVKTLSPHMKNYSSPLPVLSGASAFQNLLSSDHEGPYVWHVPWPAYLVQSPSINNVNTSVGGPQ